MDNENIALELRSCRVENKDKRKGGFILVLRGLLHQLMISSQ